MGLVAAANLSHRQGLCGKELQAEIEKVLTDAGLPCRIPAEAAPERVLTAIQRDKKRRGERLRVVLMRAIGDVFVADDVPRTALAQTLEALMARPR
jgi:3-dehydroquinate synthetase